MKVFTPFGALFCLLALLVTSGAGQGTNLSQNDTEVTGVTLHGLMLSCTVQVAKNYFQLKAGETDEINPIIDSDLWTDETLFNAFFATTAISTQKYIFAATRLFYATLDEYEDPAFYREETLSAIRGGAYGDARFRAGLFIRASIAQSFNLTALVESNNIDKETENALKQIIFTALETIRTFSDQDGFASFLNLKVGGTLAIVMDTTGSMGDEIKGVQETTRGIVESTTGTIRQPERYVLVSFNDPDVSNPLITSDSVEFLEEIDKLVADGGGDEPEMALPGILTALKVSSPRSVVYVFTDATSKETRLLDLVRAVAQFQKIRINIIVTNLELLEEAKIYYSDLTSSTLGDILYLDKPDIPYSLNYIKAGIPQRIDLVAGTYVSQKVTFYASGLTTFEILINGNYGGEYTLTDNTGNDIEVMRVTSPTVEVNSHLIEVKLEEPIEGMITLKFGIDSTIVSVSVRGESQTGIFVTYHQEQSTGLHAGRAATLTVDAFGKTEDLVLEKVVLVGRNFGNDLLEIPIFGNDVFYSSYEFEVPAEPFIAKVVGDIDGQVFQRFDPCAISPNSQYIVLRPIDDVILQPGNTIQGSTLFETELPKDVFNFQFLGRYNYVSEIADVSSVTVGDIAMLEIRFSVTAPTQEYNQENDHDNVLLVVTFKNDDPAANSYIQPFNVFVNHTTTPKCPAFEVPPFVRGTVCTDSTNDGSVCSITCEDYFQPINGISSMKCVDQKWTSTIEGCEPVGQATCRIYGDPHYETFDGMFYDYQGICIYTAVEITDDTNGTNILSINVENANRGFSRAVSWAEAVYIEYYTISITILRSLKVLVNEQSVSWPFEPGQYRINKEGSSIVIRMDGGIVVRYDGTNVVITLPGIYKNKTSGLCGDFDGDNTNDFGNFTNSIEFGDFHEIGGAHDHCVTKEEPVCEEGSDQEASAKEKCSIIINGCFDACNQEMVNVAYENCWYDMCAYEGRVEKVLELAIQTTAAICQLGGQFVCDWRNETGIEKNCPVNQHYDQHASACENSCVRRNQELVCQLPSVEACVCDDGFVKSGDNCVRVEDCGCQRNRQYFQPGAIIYNEQCTEVCRCMGGSMVCEETACSEGESCSIKNNQRQCVPLSTANCIASGDPHFTTFDGDKYDFMGACTYLFAEFNVTHLQEIYPVKILLDLENRNGDTRVSYTKEVIVKIGTQYSIKLTKDRKAVWDQYSETQFVDPNGLFEVKLNQQKIILEITGGIKVIYNGNMQATIEASSRFINKTTGLCGNYNEIQGDDVVGTENEFGSSFQVDDDCDRVAPEPIDCPPEVVPPEWLSDKYCGWLAEKNTESPLAFCFEQHDVVPYYKDCVFDMCAIGLDEATAQDSVQAYATQCAELEDACQWRQNNAQCPENSSYFCSTTCQTTCGGHISCAEDSCICDFGYVLGNGECIKEEDCGCVIENNLYREQGYEKMYANCTGFSACTGPGDWHVFQDYMCSEDEECIESSNGWSCSPKVVTQAQMFGDPHVITFDGAHYNFMGTCSYEFFRFRWAEDGFMAVVANLKENDYPEGTTSLNSVHVVIMDNGVEHVFMLKQGGDIFYTGLTFVNLRINIGLNHDGVFIHKSGVFTALRLLDIAEVRFDGKKWLQVIVNQRLSRQVDHMLSGNFDSNGVNDVLFDNIDEWLKNFIVAKLSSEECKTSGVMPKPDSGCMCPELEEKFKSDYHCGIIMNGEAFKECREEVDPQPYFDYCLTQACNTHGNAWEVESVVKVYADECQRVGVELNGWRLEAGMKMVCGPNSHYEENTSSCQKSCSDPEAKICLNTPLKRRYIEACVCDDGYLLSNDECVPVEKCGCVDPAQNSYHEHGECLPTQDCKLECVCWYGEWQCENSTCHGDRYCGINSKGNMACVWKDTCMDDNGGCSHYCSFDNGVQICKCPGGYALAADDKTCFKTGGCSRRKCSVDYNNNFDKWKIDVEIWKKEMRNYKCSQMGDCEVATAGLWWTQWMNRDGPGGCGDEETIKLLQSDHKDQMCENNEYVAALEYRLAKPKMDKMPNQMNLQTDVSEGGFQCLNADQDDEMCPDFEVRYLCVPMWCEMANTEMP